MTLLEDIQNSAVDSKSDLAALLRKCKLLAARLGSRPLEDWLLWESNGYPDDVVARMRARGAELIGEMQYEDTYRLAYIRGPEGLIVALAEQLG